MMKRTGTRSKSTPPDNIILTGTHSVVIKVGMVGDSQIGKTSLMVKYVEGSFDEDYIQTLGTCINPYVCRFGTNQSRR